MYLYYMRITVGKAWSYTGCKRLLTNTSTKYSFYRFIVFFYGAMCVSSLEICFEILFLSYKETFKFTQYHSYHTTYERFECKSPCLRRLFSTTKYLLANAESLLYPSIYNYTFIIIRFNYTQSGGNVIYSYCRHNSRFINLKISCFISIIIVLFS